MRVYFQSWIINHKSERETFEAETSHEVQQLAERRLDELGIPHIDWGGQIISPDGDAGSPTLGGYDIRPRIQLGNYSIHYVTADQIAIYADGVSVTLVEDRLLVGKASQVSGSAINRLLEQHDNEKSNIDILVELK